MPCAYHIDTVRGAIFIRGWGALCDEEVTVLGQAVRADPRFDARYVRIENLSDVTAFELSAELVKYVAKLQEKLPARRRVLVVGSEIGYGLMRMIELYADAHPDAFRACKDLGEGLRWAGLPTGVGWPDDAPTLVVDRRGA